MTVATTRFSGRAFSAREMTLIREVVQDWSGLSRMELARTVCELLRWRRPNGRLKLGALRASGDFDAYWDFHEAREVRAEPRPALR